MTEKRSTPKIMRRAGELRLNPTPAEAKLWSRLRAHRLADVGFRRQHAIGNFIVDFCAPSKMLIIEVEAVNISNRKNTMRNGLFFWSRKVIVFYGFTIMM